MSQPVSEIADRFWERYLQLDPLTATDVGDARYAGQLEDTSADGRAKARRVYEEALAALAAVEVDRLPEADRLAVDLIEFAARCGVARASANLDRLRAAAHIHGAAGVLP